jgi:putative inorganic carbon (HCO3(-)) transporter
MLSAKTSERIAQIGAIIPPRLQPFGQALGMAAALAAYILAPLPLAGAGALAFATLAVFRPRLGLAAVMATLPTYYFPRDLGGVALSLPETTLLLTAAAALTRALWKRDLQPRPTAFDWSIALLLAAALLSLLPTEYFKLSLRALRTLLLEPLLFYYLVVALCPSWSAQRSLVGALLAASGAVALLAIAQVALNVHTVEVEGVRRALGLYPSPNHLGLYLGRVLPFAIALALYIPWRRRLFGSVALLLSLAIIATFSLGTWVGTAGALLTLAGLHSRRALARVALGLGTLGALSAAGFVLLGVERVTSGATATFRRLIWTAALAMVRDHPLTGIGLDNFLYRYQLEYMPPEAWQEPNISHPHNWVLQFWLELGLLGLLAIGMVLGRFFWLAVRQWRGGCGSEQRALIAGALASMVGLLLHGLLDNSYFLVDLAYLFWWQCTLVEIGRRAEPAPPAG